jgi:glycosyltransferase involved in cell wall biosynthesis
MRILQLCKKFPFPLKDGESIAVTYLSKALNDLGHEVTLLSMNTAKHYTDVSKLPPEFDHYKDIHVTALDNTIRLKDAVLNLFSKESYHVSRFVSDVYKAKLIDLLQQNDYDVVQLETMYLSPYVDIVKEHSDALVAMRSHNVEFEIWDRITENTRFLPKKWYLRYLTNKLKQYELDHLNDYDYLISVSDRDLKKFKQLGYKNGAMASPIGLEIGNYTKVDKPVVKQDFKIGFIGALDWIPNVEGLQWFLSKVWPKVHQLRPEIELHVAGRHTPKDMLTLDMPGVVIHGEVPDAIDFTNANDLMIVPLFSGSGMRVKILEAMALGKPIVTTSLGAEGINAIDGEHVLLAEDAGTFVSQIVDAYEDQSLISTIGNQARAFVVDNYDHKAIAERLASKYQSLVDQQYGRLSRV